MHNISANGVHLAVTDVLYGKKAADDTVQTEDMVCPEETGEDDDEEEDALQEEEEGFVLDRNVPDAVLPDLTQDFSSIIQKVRNVVKFFRNIFTEIASNKKFSFLFLSQNFYMSKIVYKKNIWTWNRVTIKVQISN